MKCKVTKLGSLLIPISNIPSRNWKECKVIVGEGVRFFNYQIEGPGGLTLGHLSQDEVKDGEYDLSLTVQDFMEAYA